NPRVPARTETTARRGPRRSPGGTAPPRPRRKTASASGRSAVETIRRSSPAPPPESGRCRTSTSLSAAGRAARAARRAGTLQIETHVCRPEPKPQRGEAHDGAQEEQHRPGHAEKQHRLPAEAQLKPYGDQVQHPHRNPADAELRLP